MAAPMRDNPLDRAKGADPKTEPTSNFEYDDNEWDIGIGDLIIDLDADIEKTNERGGGGGGGSSSVVGGVSGSSGVNSGVGASVGGGGVGSGAGVTARQQQHYGGMSAGATKGSSKMATAAVEHSATVDKGLKMKIKRTKPGTKTSEAKHEIVKAPGESAGTGVVGGSVVGGVGANSGQGLQNGDDTGKVSGKHPPQSSAPPPSSGSSSSSSGSSGSGSGSGGGSKRGSSGHRRDKARDKHSDKPPSKGSGSLGAPNGNVGSAELNGVTTVPSPVAVTVLPSQGQNQVQHQGGQLQQVIQQSQDGHQVSAGSQGPQQQGNVPAVQHQIQSQVPQTSLSSSTGSSVVVSPVSGATANNASSSVAQNSQSHPTHSQMTPQISQLQIQQPQTQQLTQQHQHVPYPSGASSDGSGSGVPATGPVVVPVKVELVGGKSSLGSPAACGAVTSPATKCEEGEVTAPGGAAAGAALPVAASTPSSTGNSTGSSVSSVVSPSSATSVTTACGSTGSTTASSSPPPSKKQKTSCEPKDMLDVCVGTSVGTITEPDCLGPCEPGTSVTLEGIVWHETEGGVLVVNVTWRGKTYVGTLLDCTKHDWAPPRFCDSPTSDLDSRTAKGRGKRGRAAAAAAAAAATPSSDLSNFTETRSSVHSKLRNGGGKGRRGNGPSTVVPVGGVAVSGTGGAASTTAVVGFIPPRPEPGNKRKVRSTEGSDDAVGGVAVANGSGTGAGGKRSRSASRGPPSSPPSSPVLLECPEPNCSKKYKHINGLKYHQSHAHGAVGVVPSEEDDTKETASLSEAEESPVEAAPSPKTEGSLPGNQRQRACPTTPQSRQQPGDGASTPPTTPRTQPLPDASPDAKAVAQVKPGVLRFGPTAPEEQYSPAANEGGIYGNKTSTPASPIASGQHSVVGSIRVVGMPSLTSSPPHVNKQPPSQVPSTPQHLPPHQQDAAKLGDKYKLKGSPVTPASSPARPVVNLQQPSIKSLPTQQSQAHSVMQSPQQLPQGAKAVGIINDGQDKKEKCSGKGPPSGQQQQSPLPPVSHKKKNRKSPAGSPQPDQQGMPFNPALRDSSASMSSPVGGGEGREDVQSPAYSDISDDSAPVLESEVGEKGRGGQTVPVSVASSVQGGNAPPSVGKNSEKKAEVPNPPSGQNASSANSTAQHLAHYGMYPFYGQPPYLVPSVPPTSSSESKLSKEGTVVTAPSDKPGNMDPKGIPDRVAEKEKKEGVPVPPPSSVSGVSSSSTTPSSTGSTTSVMPPTSTTSTSVTDFQHKLMQQQQQQQQHYYPYGYVPGYPYGLEPSYQVSVMADKYAVEAAAAAASAAALEKDKSSVEKLPPTSSSEIGSNCKGSSGNMHSSQKERAIKLEVGLKEKQNENHQILKESIEMKNQMNDGKAKYGGGSVPPPSSPYESGPYLFQRQQEELRRFYLYPPEQRRKESGPGGPLDATVSGAKPASSDIKPSISVPPPPKPITSSALPSPKSNSREHIRNEKCGNGSADEKKESGGPDKSAIPKQEGVKPTMETQGPPPPTSYSYIHPGYMQSPHYGALPFDPVYRGLNQMLVPGPYGTGPYLHPQMRYHAPEDLSRPGVAAAAAAAAAAAVSAGPTKALDLLQHHASQYYSSHKIHELQERALKSPTPKTAPSPSGSVSGSSSTTCSQPPPGVVQSTGPSPTSIPKSQQAPPPPVAVGSGGPGGPVPPSGDGKEVGGGPGSGSVGGGGLRSPPPQRHVHTHHHTHVGLGYPLLAGQYGPAAPYGAVLASQQAAAVAATVINPYPPK